jgi:hypothetical protein
VDISPGLLSAIAAQAVLVLHFAYIVFVIGGAALLPRWPRLALLHVPAVVWAAFVEFSGTVCPLTPVENHFRMRGGQPGYGGGFVEHYLLPLIYPSGLTRDTELVLGLCVVFLNMALYVRWLGRRREGA